MTFQQPFEEGATNREDHLASFETLILTSQGDISEVGVIPQLSNRGNQNILKVVPLQAKLLVRHGPDVILLFCHNFASHRPKMYTSSKKTVLDRIRNIMKTM